MSQQLAQTQASLSDAQKRLADLDQQLTVQQARPKNIPTELSELKQQTAELESKLQAATPTTTTLLLAQARLLALTTQRQALNQQIAMLEQERLSYDVRYALLNARRAVAAQEVARAQTRAQQLQSLLNARRRDEADRGGAADRPGHAGGRRQTGRDPGRRRRKRRHQSPVGGTGPEQRRHRRPPERKSTSISRN
ncbi:MAG: hypothetical protein MZV65_01960 [Chromatiales bacterium]|nr:hypothetical protein [Chromatiales bacterium]